MLGTFILIARSLGAAIVEIFANGTFVEILNFGIQFLIILVYATRPLTSL